ncbi:DUF5722 domain-containing protein [Cohnella sp. JJ-181]|uniref:DUF5722 domain-containing protein n=1 Tax=Cohnella rhizoplanae TaxID=2974897 RepID=UPI0022FF9C14|nr:DUF5722 domain-containing protein [Cohnella sp. JJ-181]CAI6085297.1 hypothetical protein COHCIP112018_04626 [Cohnella sp. JJ-181]
MRLISKRWLAATVCLALLLPFMPAGGGERATAAVLETEIGGFEGGTDNWQWGANVTGLAHVASSANAPTTPYSGNRMAELSTASVPGTSWRAVYRNFSPALNVSSTPYFHGAFNTFGINASNTQFEARITFYSNSQTLVSTQSIQGDRWNELGVDLSGWSYRNAITKIEVAFRSVTYASNWAGKHQLDNVGFSAYPAVYPGSVSQATASATQIVVSGTYATSSAAQLDLIELQPYEKYDMTAVYTAAATQSVTPGGGVASFALSGSRYDGSRDKVYSKFVVVDHATKKPVASPTYVTSQTAPASTYAFPAAASIKGLQVQTIDDAQKLGIGHAALNVAFNELFSDSATGAVPFVMDGTTYYLNASYVGQLDRDIKTLSDDGVVVSLILILYPDTGTINAKLTHPGYSGSGTVAAIDVTDADGIRYWKAGIEFLASRYTRADQQYGRAVNYIVGNEVNSQFAWYDMGSKTLQDFVEQYARAFRIAETAVKKYYANGRTYISLDHFWNGSIGTDALRAYKGKALLDEFNRRIKAEGNIPWNIAYHPYPEDLFDPTVWNDTTATNSADTIRVTFKNLQVLTGYIAASDYLYNGSKRRIILSEQGFHSLSNSLADQKTQAAAYAYAYYKAKFLGGIDSFILHRHVDHGQEGGLNLGLWTRDPTKSVASAPKDPKYVYDVFQKIDTSESAAVTNFAKSIIGISDWASVIPGYNAGQLADREAPAAGTLTAVGSISPSLAVSGFETSTDGWAASEYAASVASVSSFANAPGTPFAGTKSLEINMDIGTAAGEGVGGARAEKGIVKKFASPVNASAAPKFQFAIDSYGSAPGATQYKVTVRLYSGTHILEGKATLTPNAWNKFSMDTSAWPYEGSVDKIKIWFSADSTALWSAKYQVDQIGFGV